MTWLSRFRIIAIAALWLVSLPGAAFAQQGPMKELIVGTWAFVSSNAKGPDGNPLWGANPNGFFILTDNGHFSWQVFSSDRPKFAGNDRLRATPDEYTRTMQGSLAYFGTYTINEAAKTISFKTDGSTFPNSEGEVLKRVITKLSADDLIYTNPATTTGASVDAVWKRVK